MGSKEVFLEIKGAIHEIYGEKESESIAYRILDLVFGVGKLDYLLNKELVLPVHWNYWLKELEMGKPFQYVIGKEFFRELVIGLNKATLIPRPETEELIHYILIELNQRTTPVRVLDIGTGSGCIPLALKNEFPSAEIVAWEIAEEALEQAQINAKNLNLSVDFQKQDVFDWPHRQEKWDLIVSNPPYVLEKEKTEMQPHVLDYEPSLALFVPNEDPLKFYHCIAQMARQRLNEGGSLFFEINQAFGSAIKTLLIEMGFKEVEILVDFRGKDRIVVGKWD